MCNVGKIFNTTALAMLLAGSVCLPAQSYPLQTGWDMERLAATAANLVTPYPTQSDKDERIILPQEERDLARLDRLVELDQLYEEQENYTAEEKILLETITLLKESTTLPKSLLGSAYSKLATLYINTEQWPLALSCARRSVAIMKSCETPLSQDMAVALNNLGWIEYQLGKPSPALVHIREAAYITEKVSGNHSLMYAWMANNLGEIYQLLHDERNSALWFKRCDEAISSALSGGLKQINQGKYTGVAPRRPQSKSAGVVHKTKNRHK